MIYKTLHWKQHEPHKNRGWAQVLLWKGSISSTNISRAEVLTTERMIPREAYNSPADINKNVDI
jgi:hypothetical protein